MNELYNIICAWFKPLFDALIVWAKPLTYSLLAALISQLAPIKTVLIVVGLSFMLNLILGIRADSVIHKNPFNPKKFRESIYLMGFFFIIIYIINCTTWDDESTRSFCVRWLSYVIVWGYMVNCLKNARELWPGSKAIGLLYEVMTTEILFRLKSELGLSRSKDEEPVHDKTKA